MAEVLAPISSTNTMSMHRSQDVFQSNPDQRARLGQMPRNSMYNPQLTASMAYRGQNMNIAPYAYQAPQMPMQKQDRRKSAGPVMKSHSLQQPMPPYHESTSSAASSASSSSNQSGNYIISKDDSVLGYQRQQNVVQNRLSANMASMSVPDLSIANNQLARPSPDRYRRNSRQDSTPVEPEYQRQARPVSAPIPVYNIVIPPQNVSQPNPPSPLRRYPTDESISTQAQNAGRYKRRSIATMGAVPPVAHRSVSTPVVVNGPSWSQVASGNHGFQNKLSPPVAQYSRPQHVRSNSSEIRAQGMRPASSRNSTYSPSQSPNLRPTTAPNPLPRPRSSLGTPVNSAKTAQRPVTTGHAARDTEQIARPSTAGSRLMNDELKSAPAPSPAAQQLAALNQKSNPKGMKSRIRRAFSFSSSSELRKATAENNLAAERAKVRKERFEGDSLKQDPDAAVAAQQEANGLGNGIYNGQGQFASSTDNLSMASTASSASMMLRSLGRGMKKSSRNLRGLFRPKSMIEPPTSDDLSPSIAQVSHVTVEAEREIINVNADPHDVPGGGTTYPKLERNSVEQMSDAQSLGSRKSIVGGDRERAEVLAAVRKGILKRSGTSSTSSSPVLLQGETPMTLPSQHSAPGSPASRLSAEGRDGYFAGQTNSGSTRSLPTQSVRNVSFGQRVQFFDVWSPTEYDRRGDVATCNRLTPMLAQQIKEELNSFKMEMEVHEKSKPHTHFF